MGAGGRPAFFPRRSARDIVVLPAHLKPITSRTRGVLSSAAKINRQRSLIDRTIDRFADVSQLKATRPASSPTCWYTRGATPWIIDLSMKSHTESAADVSGARVAEAAGASWHMINERSRQEAAACSRAMVCRTLNNASRAAVLAGDTRQILLPEEVDLFPWRDAHGAAFIEARYR
jgi:hypothetical protein